MKHLSFLSLLLLCVGCSKFNMDDTLLLTEIVSDLPVINITVDRNEFEEMYEKTDEEIEIKGRFNLTRGDELVIANEKVELELKGRFSIRFPLKTLGVKFDNKYDNRDRSLINPVTVLPNHSIDKIKAIRLRNSGNDFENTMLKDLSITQLAINAGLDIDLTYGEPVLVYINEEFYGLMNLRTEANTNGMAGLNQVDKSNVTLAKITTQELLKKDGDFNRIDALLEAIENKNIAYLKNEIDLKSFIDYMIFQSYIGNTDWPHNNARFYAIDGGKFRFVLFDLDNASRLNLGKSPVNLIDNFRSSNILGDLFMALYEDKNDDTFQRNFLERYREILRSGEISADKLEKIVDENASRIEAEIAHQIAKYNAPRTTLEWRIELDKMLILFREREAAVQEHIK